MTSIVLAMLAVVVVSAFASGTEAALFAVPKSKVMAFVAQGRKGAKALNQIKEDMSRPIMTIVIVNNIANIVGSIFVGYLAQQEFNSYVGVISATLTFLVIAFAEVVPKTVGERKHDRISLWMAPFILLLSKALFPLILLIEIITKPFSKWAGGEFAAVTSEEEILELTKAGSQAGIIDKEESEMIERVFQLNDLTAWDIMTPLARVNSLDGRLSLGEIRGRLDELVHTRLPVHKGSLDKVTGVVHMRDVLRALAESKEHLTLEELANPPSFMPSNASGDDLLKHFKRSKQHLAIVVDAYGTVLGILTLEDVLEELVGDIVDETDIVSEEIERIAEDEVSVLAEVDAVDVNELLGTELPDQRVGALLIEHLGRIPTEGETFQCHGVEVTITKASPRMIENVRLRRLEIEEITREDTESAAS